MDKKGQEFCEMKRDKGKCANFMDDCALTCGSCGTTVETTVETTGTPTIIPTTTSVITQCKIMILQNHYVSSRLKHVKI